MLKINLLLASLLMASFFSDVAEATSIKINLDNDPKRLRITQSTPSGRQQEAFYRNLQYYQNKRRKESQNADFYRQQAVIARQQAAIKRQKEIQRWRDSIPELENKRDYLTLSMTLSRLGEWSKSLDAAEKAVKANPNSADAYNLRGLRKEWFKDLQGALADYNRAIELDQISFYAPYVNRGRIKKSFDRNGAIQDFRIAMKLVRVDPRISYIRDLTTEKIIRELQSLGVTE